MNKPKMLLILILIAAISVISPVTAIAEVMEPVILTESTEPVLNMTELTLPANIIQDGTKYTAFTWLRVTGTTKDVKWSISDKKVAKLVKTKTKNMISVNAKKKGKATITAKIGKKKLKCKLTVTEPLSKEDFTKFVKVDMTNVDKQYLTITNTSKYHILFSGDTHYYNVNNEELASYSLSLMYMDPGETRKVYSENSKYPGIDHWDFTFDITGIDYEYHPVSATAEIKEMEGHILPVVVTNVSDYIEGLYEVTAFFMKDGEVVWAEKEHTEKTLEPGEYATVTYGIYDRVPAYDEILIDIQR